MHLLMMALVLQLFFAIVVALGLYHAPGPVQWAVSKLGAGGYAVAVHVLVYLMIGGVTGHIVGMGIAVPSFLIAWAWLRAALKEKGDAWFAGWPLRNKALAFAASVKNVWDGLVAKLGDDSSDAPAAPAAC